MPRRSASGSFAVPMSMPRYSCMASALTISAARPAAPPEPRRGRATSRSCPVPVAPTTAIRRRGVVSQPAALCRCRSVGRPSDTLAVGPRGADRDGAGLGLRRGPRRRRRAVRRIRSGAPSGESAMRWNGAAWVTATVTTSPGRGTSLPAGSSKWTRRLSSARPLSRCVCGVLAALALGDEHLDLAADDRAVLFPRDAFLQGGEPLVAFLYDRLRHLVRHRRGGGALADRVLEGEGRREPGCLDHAQGVLEVFLGLAGEADDDVGRDGRIRDAARAPDRGCRGTWLGAVRAAHRLAGSGREPDCSGMCSCGMTAGVSAIASMTSSVKAAGCGLVKRMRSRPSISPAARSSLPNACAVAELDAVGVDVLAEQGDLDGAVVDERPDLGQDVAGAAVLLLAPQRRHDAEGAGVVAADRDRHPAAVHGVALGRQGRREHLERLEDLELRLAVVAGALEQRRQRTHVVGAEDHVDPGRLVEDRLLVLLRQAPADGDLHAVMLGLAPTRGGRGCRRACCRRCPAPHRC